MTSPVDNMFTDILDAYSADVKSKEFFKPGTLPEMVFVKGFKKFIVIEHGYLLLRPFSDMLYNIANDNCDSAITYISILPHVCQKRYISLDSYGGFSLPTSSICESFASTMIADRHADSLAFRGGDIACAWGNSGKWSIYVDRISWELIIIGFLDKEYNPSLNGVRALSKETLISYAQSQGIPRHKAETLASNYAI